jgi:hypothetical protein
MPTNPLYLHCEGRTGNFISSLVFKHALVNLTHGAQNYEKHLIQKAQCPKDYYMKDYMPLAHFRNHKTGLQSSVEATKFFTSNSSAWAVPKNL